MDTTEFIVFKKVGDDKYDFYCTTNDEAQAKAFADTIRGKVMQGEKEIYVAR